MACASSAPTFGYLLGKIRKVNPHIGVVEDCFYYDVSKLSEEQKYRWTSAVIRFSVVTLVSVPNCNKDKLLKVYHGFMRFNHYAFVKKLENRKIISSEEIFQNIQSCLYN